MDLFLKNHCESRKQFLLIIFPLFLSSVTSLSNLPAIRKTQGSISSTDSGHSEVGYCEGNVYHITSSIIHNVPSQQTMPAPLPPRRHSAVQQGSANTPTNLFQMIPPNSVNCSTKSNGDMPPPPNPRTRPVPFPIGVPVIPGVANANVAGQYNLYATSQQQYQQLRHTGWLQFFLNMIKIKILRIVKFYILRIFYLIGLISLKGTF